MVSGVSHANGNESRCVLSAEAGAPSLRVTAVVTISLRVVICEHTKPLIGVFLNFVSEKQSVHKCLHVLYLLDLMSHSPGHL